MDYGVQHFFHFLVKARLKKYNNYQTVWAKIILILHSNSFLSLSPSLPLQPSLNHSYGAAYCFNEQLEMTALITACSHGKGSVNDRKEQRAISINQS